MDVGYEKCDDCKNIYPDCGDNYPRDVNIDGDNRTICPTCLEDMKEKLDQSLDVYDKLHGLLFYFTYRQEDKKDQTVYYAETDLYKGRTKMIEVAKENPSWTEFGLLICDESLIESETIALLKKDGTACDPEMQKAARIQNNLARAWEYAYDNANTMFFMQIERINIYDSERAKYDDESSVNMPTCPESPLKLCAPEDCLVECSDDDVEETVQDAIDAYCEWLNKHHMLGDDMAFVSRDQTSMRVTRIATLKKEVVERLVAIRATANQDRDHAIANAFGASIYKHDRDRVRADAFGNLLPMIFAFVDNYKVYDKSLHEDINLAFCHELIAAYQKGVDSAKPANVKRKRESEYEASECDTVKKHKL